LSFIMTRSLPLNPRSVHVNAREVLQTFPQAIVRTAQLLNSTSAKVIVTAKLCPKCNQPH
jgi:hypothetical protein